MPVRADAFENRTSLYNSRPGPSCIARRMSETAAFLVDRLLPRAPYRQWVISFPWPLRFRLAMDRKFLSAMTTTFLRTIFAWQRLRGRQLGIAPGRSGQTGSVTFMQRYGGALNVNPYGHAILPDGLFVPDTIATVPATASSFG